MHVLIHFTCILTKLWIALNIMIALSYIHYSINDYLSNNAHINPFFNHFYMYDFELMIAEIQKFISE